MRHSEKEDLIIVGVTLIVGAIVIIGGSILILTFLEKVGELI